MLEKLWVKSTGNYFVNKSIYLTYELIFQRRSRSRSDFDPAKNSYLKNKKVAKTTKFYSLFNFNYYFY